MPRLHYRDPGTGTWIPISTQGPAGPTAVSTDANNTAVIGSDSLIFVPAPTPPVLDHGGLTGLADDDHPQYAKLLYAQNFAAAEMLTNGFGFQGLLNWPVSATLAQDEVYAGQASFLTPSMSAGWFHTEVIPVDPAKTYFHSVWVKDQPKAGASTFYIALICLDIDGLGIETLMTEQYFYFPSKTTLTEDLNPGDTTIKVASTAGFRVSNNNRTLAIGPYTNSKGYTYPDSVSGPTYTRHVNQSADSRYTIIDSTTLGLPVGWYNPHKPGVTYSAGSWIIESGLGGSYLYPFTGTMTPGIWNLASGKSGAGTSYPFRAGTAYIKPGYLINYTTVGRQYLSAASIREVISATMLDPALATDIEVATAVTAHTSGQPHSALASTAPAALTPDIAGAVGVGTTTARADHVHSVPAAVVVALGAANAEGSSGSFARADHVHIYPTAANVGADATGTAASAVTTHAGAADPHTGYQKESEKGAINGYAALDGSGVIPTSQLPPLAVNDVFTVADQAAMLALTAQVGDMAVRADSGRTYVLSASPATVLANWKEIMAAGQVQSVNTQTGVVSLTATNIPSTAVGDVVAVNVQAAIAELASEKAVLTAVAPAALTPDIAAAVGVGTTAARVDHVHNVAAGVPVALGAANAEGNAADFARSNHVHIYPTAANVGAEASGTVATHAGAADPHTGYQKESEKGAVNGYASLDGTGLVPIGQLPAMGVADEVLVQAAAPTPAVGLDLWVDSDAVAPVSDHGNFAGLADDDHPQYINISRGDTRYVTKTGATMSGPLLVPEPTVDSHAATKKYVDDLGTAESAQIALKVSKAGDTMSGPLVIPTPPTIDAHAASKKYVDDTVNASVQGVLAQTGRNRIINGDFSVNQRAFTSAASANGYGLDRWAVYGGGGVFTHSAQTPALGDLPESARTNVRIATSGQAAASDYALLQQPIESVRTLSGKTATVSFWAKAASGTPKVAIELTQNFATGGSPSATVYVYAGQITLSTTWTRYSITVAVPSIAGKTLGTGANDSLAIDFWASAGTTYNARTGSLGVQNNTFDFWGVQVEEGVTATPYEQKSYADELRACQRYYYRLNQSGPSTRFCAGWAPTTTTWETVINHPVPMRAKPSVGKSGVIGLSNGAVYGVTDIGLSLYTITESGPPYSTSAIQKVGGTGTLTALCVYFLETGGAGSAYIDFSAEL